MAGLASAAEPGDAADAANAEANFGIAAATDPSAPTTPDPAAALMPPAEFYWEALRIFRHGTPREWQRGRRLLQSAAELDVRQAQHELAAFYLTGSYGFGQDPAKAAEYFERAAVQGSAYAAVNLGLAYFNGNGVSQNHEKATHWLSAAIAENADYNMLPWPEDFLRPVMPAQGGTLSGAVAVDPVDTARATAHFVLGEIHTAKAQAGLAHEHYVKAATMGPAARSGVYLAAIKAAVGFALGLGAPRDSARATEMLNLSRKLSRRLSMTQAHGLVEKKLLDDFAQADAEAQFATEMDRVQKAVLFQIGAQLANANSPVYDPREAMKWYEMAAEAGERSAMLALAFLHHEGKGGERDPQKVFEYFKMAAEKGNDLSGHLNLAICYDQGIGTERDPVKAASIYSAHRDRGMGCYLGSIGQAPKEFLTFAQELDLARAWATEKKDPHAWYLLGIAHLNGWGVPANTKEAVAHFERAGDSGHGQAFCQLGVLYELQSALLGVTPEAGIVRAAEYYRKGSEAGEAFSLVNLATCYREGRGVKRDLRKAIKLAEKSLVVLPSLARAETLLGVIYQDLFLEAKARNDAEAMEENKRKTLHHYQAGARMKEPTAAKNLGALAYNGTFGEKDFREAYLQLTTAAEGGVASARRLLGTMHQKGQGVPVTPREAAYHYRLAALAGDQLALGALCNMYLSGVELPRDLGRMTFWLKMLEAKGEPAAKVRASVALADIAMQEKDYASAQKMYERYAQSEDPRLKGHGLYGLSMLYGQGLGVLKDTAKARDCFQKARDLKNDRALFAIAGHLHKAGRKKEAIALLERIVNTWHGAAYALGSFYYRGDTVKQDRSKGLALLRQAAYSGNSSAQHFLANLTLRQQPGAPAMDEALRLAEAAESAGHRSAPKLREQLEAKNAVPMN